MKKILQAFLITVGVSGWLYILGICLLAESWISLFFWGFVSLFVFVFLFLDILDV